MHNRGEYVQTEHGEGRIIQVMTSSAGVVYRILLTDGLKRHTEIDVAHDELERARTAQDARKGAE